MSKKKLTLGFSPLSGTISAGHLIEKGTVWGANKQDVTMDALLTVIELLLKKGTQQIKTQDGKVDFELSVKDLR